MRARKVLLTIAVAGVAVAMALPAGAVQVTMSFIGQVDPVQPVDADNQFGLSQGEVLGDLTDPNNPANPLNSFTSWDDETLDPIDVWWDGSPLMPNVENGALWYVTDATEFNIVMGDFSFDAFDNAPDISGFPPLLYFYDAVGDGTNIDLVGFECFLEAEVVDESGNSQIFTFESFIFNYLFPEGGVPFEVGRLAFQAEDANGVPVLGDFYFPPGVLPDVDLPPNPVPEPGTMILLGSGLLGLAGYGRKRRKE